VSATGLAVLFTLAAGAAGSLQAAINTRLGQRIGILEAATFQTMIALLLFLVAVLVARGSVAGVGSAFRQPPWMWLGGVMGFVIVSALTYAPAKLGTLGFSGVYIALQLATAAFIDAFGLFGFERLGLSWHRALGLVLLAAGAALVLKR
jgi:transporter family-2 protein